MKFLGADSEILVKSHNVALGEALVSHARQRMRETSGKYFNRITEATIHFKKEGASFECSVSMKVGALAPFVAKTLHHDIYTALHEALTKVAHQLQRSKQRLRDDAAQRSDKEVGLDGNLHVLGARPGSEDFGSDLPDLRDVGEADDYVKALTQKGMQEAAERSQRDREYRELEIVTSRLEHRPIAAE